MTWGLSLTENVLQIIDVPLEEMQRNHVHIKVSMLLFCFFHIGSLGVHKHRLVYMWVLIYGIVDCGAELIGGVVYF